MWGLLVSQRAIWFVLSAPWASHVIITQLLSTPAAPVHAHSDRNWQLTSRGSWQKAPVKMHSDQAIALSVVDFVIYSLNAQRSGFHASPRSLSFPSCHPTLHKKTFFVWNITAVMAAKTRPPIVKSFNTGWRKMLTKPEVMGSWQNLIC